MKNIFIILGFLIIFGTANFASAQIFLEEGKLTLDIKPGENISKTLTVHNTSNKEFKVKAYWEDFTYQPPFDGTKKFFPLGSNPQSAGSWVSFSPRDFVLPPFGKKDISYVINAPQDIHGGYYGVLFVEKEPEESKDIRGLNIVSRIGCLFFLESANKNKNAELGDIFIEESQVKGTLLNQGDVVLIPDGTFYMMNADSLIADRGSVNKVYLPPGAKADYAFDFNKDLPTGQYTLVVTLDLGAGDVLVKELDFVKKSDSNFQILEIRN